jgi:flagellin
VYRQQIKDSKVASVISTNVASLNAQRNLTSSQSSLATSLQRLSSGLRINSAKDDAAGLAIADRFTTQIRGLNQASRNANDAISLSQTAEGALGEVTSNLQRIRELAVQSANATNSSSDRAALDLEVQQRLAEIDRISSSTSFNGQKILDGSFGNAAFQVGANVGETISLDLTTSMRQDQIGLVSKPTSADMSAVFSGGGTIAGTTVQSGYTDGDLTINGTALTGSTADAKSIADTINTNVDGVTAIAQTNTSTFAFSEIKNNGSTANQVLVYGLDVTLNQPDGTTSTKNITHYIGRVDLFDAGSLVNDINAAFGETVAQVNTNGTDIDLTSTDGSNITVANQTIGNFFSSPYTGTGITTGTASSSFSLTSDSAISIAGATPANAGLSSGTYGALDLVSGDLSVAIGTAAAVDIIGSFSSGSDLAMYINTNVEGANAVFDTTANTLSISAGEDVTLAGTDATTAVDADGAASGLGFASLTNPASGSLVTANVTTVVDANETILRIDAALKSVSDLRSTFGAIQNRFESTISNLGTAVENLSAARSRILDADFASETANLTRAQILQQAGTAMLSQANSLPQNVLSLLG